MLRREEFAPIDNRLQQGAYSMSMIEALQDMHQKKILTDVEIIVPPSVECNMNEGEKQNVLDQKESRFPVHQALLYAACPFFRTLYSPEKRSYVIDSIAPTVMAEIIEFIYTNNLEVHTDNVLPLLKAAQKLQMDGITKKCVEFLSKSICTANCVAILEFGREYKNQTLVDLALMYISKNFLDVCSQCSGFGRVAYEDLKALLNADELNLHDEGKGFEAVLRWIEVDHEKRQRCLPSLLSAIRFGLCDVRFLQDQVFKHANIAGDVDCLAALEPVHALMDQLEMHEGPRLINLSHPMLRPRIPRDVLFVIGGWSNGSATNLVEAYDCRANRWLIFPNDRDTQPRAYHGLVALDGLLYMIGGFDGSQCFNDVRCFNPRLHMWTEKACMHVARCYVSVAVLNDQIYALGGYDGERRTNTAERYNPKTNSWSLVADMNDQRSDACATVVHGKVYIVGGFTGQQVLNTAECYDPKGNTWTYIRPMTVPRSGVRVVTYQETLYVLGGFNGTNRLATGEKYDFLRDRWLEVPNMQTPRSNFAVAVLDELLFAIGGFNGTTTVAHVECFDGRGNQWRKLTDMNINRSALGACVAISLANSKDFSVVGNSGTES